MDWGRRERCRGLTILEMVIAMAIMSIIFAVVLPQFKNIKNSWDSKRANAEILQNGRVFAECLNRYLAKANMIRAISDPSETDGYIEFTGNDGTTYRCRISAADYIEFGPVGDLSEIAGPVSALQFSCYSLNDLDTPTTGLGSIRFVQIDTTFTNSNPTGNDRDFSTRVYLRTNGNSMSVPMKKGNSNEFDPVMGQDTSLAQVDSAHYLLAYTGSGDDGYALILTVDTDTGDIIAGTECEFDTTMGRTPALCQVDSTHYLCAYQGTGQDGYAVILTVDTATWTVSENTAMVFDANGGQYPDICLIDSTHYLCVYQGDMDDGYAVVLTVNTDTWEITAGAGLEYDTQDGKTPSLSRADSTHYICAYQASGGSGKAVILEVNTADWSVSKKSPHTFDSGNVLTPVLCAIDSTHHLCVWQSFSSNDGNARVLTINDGNWTISGETLFEFDLQISAPALCQIDADDYLCAYEGQGKTGSSVVLNVDTSDYSITKGEPSEFDEYAPNTTPDLCRINANDYLCSYTGDGADGWSVVVFLGIKP